VVFLDHERTHVGKPRRRRDGSNRQSPAYDRARAAVRYDDIARTLVLGFKYGDRLDHAAMMRCWMARAGHKLTRDADALLPVPLHWRRLWARRFNQSAALAAAISEICGVPVLYDALERVRATPQQVGLSKPERADNVQGAFRVPADQKVSVAGRRLVLINDVLVFARVVAPVRSPI
jgi:predicted amidophosphoribosyltransferase